MMQHYNSEAQNVDFHYLINILILFFMCRLKLTP